MSYVDTFVNIANAGILAVGVFFIFNGILQIAKSHREQRPSDGSEWWTIVLGAMLVAFNLTGLLRTLVHSITDAR